MTQQLLNVTQPYSLFQQMRGETVSKGIDRSMWMDA